MSTLPNITDQEAIKLMNKIIQQDGRFHCPFVNVLPKGTFHSDCIKFECIRYVSETRGADQEMSLLILWITQRKTEPLKPRLSYRNQRRQTFAPN